MIRNKLFGIGLILTLIISVSFTGCTSDDDDDDGTAGKGGSNNNAGSGEDKGPYTFTGVALGLLDDLPIEGLTVKAKHNTKLTDLPDVAPTTTASDGTFTLTGMTDPEFCVFVEPTEGDNATILIITCNVASDSKDREIIVTPLAVAAGINNALFPDEDPNPELASAAGGVYFVDPSGAEVAVDCATVEIEPMGPDSEVIYFKNAFPDRSGSSTDISGRFLGVKLQPGEVTMTAKINGEVVGTTTLQIQAPAATGATYNSNISRIYPEGVTSDPTPDCPTE